MTSPALTREQAAEEFAVSPSTIRRLIAAGHLKAVRVGTQIRITRAALDAYLDQNAAVR